jgi:hypothetical protein
MCTPSNHYEILTKSKEIKDRIELLRTENPKIYAALNPVLDSLMGWIHEANYLIMNNHNSIRDSSDVVVTIGGREVNINRDPYAKT